MPWIKCSDRLPPIGQRVLVADHESVNLDRMAMVAEVDGRVLFPSDPRHASLAKPTWVVYDGITHWMPLPDPPISESGLVANPTDHQAPAPGALVHPVVGLRAEDA